MQNAQIVHDNRSADIDPLGYLPILGLDHHRIHEGNRFTISSIDEAVAADTPKYWLFFSPSLPLIHFTFKAETSRSGTLRFFRNPTVGAVGTPLNIENNNQNALQEATLLAYVDPTITDDGVFCVGHVIGSDGDVNTNKGGTGGSMERSAEWILKRNKYYLLKFDAEIDDTRVCINCGPYEQT